MGLSPGGVAGGGIRRPGDRLAMSIRGFRNGLQLSAQGPVVVRWSFPGQSDRGAPEASHDIKTYPGRTCVARQGTRWHQDGVTPRVTCTTTSLRYGASWALHWFTPAMHAMRPRGRERACRAVGLHQAFRCAARHHIGGIVLL